MAVRYSLTIAELAELLARHFGLQEGYWELGFNIEATPAQLTKASESPTPGVVLRFTGVNFAEQAEAKPGTYDAAKLVGAEAKPKTGGGKQQPTRLFALTPKGGGDQARE